MHSGLDHQVDRTDGVASCPTEAIPHAFPLVYDELRTMAHRRFEGVPADLTLQPTEIVHEAYLKLIASAVHADGDMAYVRAVASIAMRHVLIDYLRSRHAQKRRGNRHRIELSGGGLLSCHDERVDLLDLVEAMERLAKLSETQSTILELRFLGNLSMAETARILGMTERSVKTESKMACAWLRTQLSDLK